MGAVVAALGPVGDDSGRTAQTGNGKGLQFAQVTGAGQRASGHLATRLGRDVLLRRLAQELVQGIGRVRDEGFQQRARRAGHAQ